MIDLDFLEVSDLFQGGVERDTDGDVTILPNREWMENNLWIRTKAGRVERFMLNPVQVELDNAVHRLAAEGRPIRLIILKARQMGSSTWTEAFGYGITRLNEHHSAGIIGNETENSNHLFSMFELYHQRDEGAPELKRHNRKALLYDDAHGSSVIVTTAQKANAATGHTNQFVHCSEVSKWRDANTTMDSLLPTIPKYIDNPHAMVVIESTAFGASGYFYNLWRSAMRKENDWTPLFFAWFDDPRYRMPVGSYSLAKIGVDPRYNLSTDEELILREEHGCDDEQLTWRRWTIDNDSGGDIEKFHQEYPATWREAFLASGRPRFSIPTLTRWAEDNVVEPIWIGDIDPRGTWVEGDENGFVHIWEWPDPNEEYAIGGDCCEGNADGDFSAATVIGKRSRRMVARIYGHLGEFESDAYGYRLQQVGYRYNTALLAPEINAYGLAVVEWLLKEKYPNLYYHTTKGEKGKKPLKKAGWRTQAGTKELLVSDLAAAIRDETIYVPCRDTIDELMGFMVLENGKTGNDPDDREAHDDLVIALGITIQALAFNMDSIYRNWNPAAVRRKKN